MAKKQSAPRAPETVHLEDGGFVWDVPRDGLAGLTPSGVNSGGMILANIRQKVSIVHGDTPVDYTISVYITRDPIGNDESALVSDAKAASKANKDAKAKELAEQHTRDVQAAVKLTTEMMREGQTLGRADAIESIQNVAKLAPALRTIKELANTL